MHESWYMRLYTDVIWNLAASSQSCVIDPVFFTVRDKIGIGTLINAFFNGPMIQAFKDMMMKKTVIA